MDDLGHRHPRQIDEVGVAEQLQFLPHKLQQLCRQWLVGAVRQRVAGHAALPQLLQDHREQRFRAGEVVVDGALGDPGRFGDAVHAGGLVSRRPEFVHRRTHDGFTFAVGQTFGRIGHGTA
ncbi:hypothetical protein G6F68_014597 [Rhizopus microsporus]|nr:hypothetical protein G6F68_014597 [Rhizopus microsporus]